MRWRKEIIAVAMLYPHVGGCKKTKPRRVPGSVSLVLSLILCAKRTQRKASRKDEISEKDNAFYRYVLHGSIIENILLLCNCPPVDNHTAYSKIPSRFTSYRICSCTRR